VPSVDEIFSEFLALAIKLASGPCWYCDGGGQVPRRFLDVQGSALLSSNQAQLCECPECKGTGTYVPAPDEDAVACGVYGFLTGAIAGARRMGRYDDLERLLDLQISYGMALAKKAAENLTADKLALLHERLELPAQEAPAQEDGALSPDEIAELLGETKENPDG
jgi:hypothetical protein